MENPPAPRKRVKSADIPVSEPITELQPPKRKPRAPRKQRIKRPTHKLSNRLLLIGTEVVCLVVTAVSAIIVLLGYSANWFSGTHFFSNLLPFAIGVLGLVLLTTALLIGWWKLRKCCHNKSVFLAPTLASTMALGMIWFITQDSYSQAFGHFRTLVGGKQEASRITLAHQVYAAYRRYESVQLQRLVDRSRFYNADIESAAKAFDIDQNLLQGIAATESSFLPRDSQDGGHGLFQITLVPKVVTEQAKQHLNVTMLSLENPKHNAYIAAATLKHYLAEMHGDLFLSLLAYNIGPKNGGLLFIMQKYGVTDFVTIQPYLQQLPRDYPIRVLSYALAFRLWQTEGKLLTYAEGRNALRIQRIGIPGLQMHL